MNSAVSNVEGTIALLIQQILTLLVFISLAILFTTARNKN